MNKLLRMPLFWILLAAAALRLTGLFWGLPASDGWDDDGFAPRNFLTALALTWKPGSFFTYPPLHALFLALPALPVAGWALAHAPSLSQHDVIATITQPTIMTYFAVLGRAVNIVLSLGIIWSTGEMVRLVAGPRAGLCAAVAAALNMALTYYGQVSNLDVPYLFWACLSLLMVMRAMMEQAPRRFWWAALFAACAVATKDQAYALFLLALPAALVLWFAGDAWPRAHAKPVLLALALAGAAALLGLLLADGALTNPAGFAKRLAFLAGPASQDYAEYTRNPIGWLALLGDMAGYYLRGPGIVPTILAVAGVAIVLRMTGARRAAALVPLLAAVSFTLCFNFAALRTDDRFLLPQALLACVYIGIAAERLAFTAKPLPRLLGRAALTAAALLALHYAVAVSAAMLLDPRYDAERWMAANVRPGDTIETYGQNCFLPRFPAGAQVTRIGQTDLRARNPLPGVSEVRMAFSGRRPAPRYIVVSGNWVRRYLRPQRVPAPGHIYSPIQQAEFRDHDARRFFAGLNGGQLGYRLVHVAGAAHGFWPVVHIHDSLNEPIGIFELAP